MKKTAIIIPTRLGAKRFPNKPLAKINNIPMIIHVLNRAKESKVGEVFVATPDTEIIHYPNGLTDYLKSELNNRKIMGDTVFSNEKETGKERIEWALAWPDDNDDGFLNSYCNTIPTPQGGTHEAGLKSALLKGVRTYSDLSGMTKRNTQITTEDIMAG